MAVFNYSAITSRGLEPIEIDMAKAERDNNSVVVENINTKGVSTILLSFSGSNQITKVTIDVKDDTSKQSFIRYNTMQVSPGSETYHQNTVNLDCTGTLYALKITWNKDSVLNLASTTVALSAYDVQLDSIILNSPVPYQIHLSRLSLIIIVGLIICSISHFRLWSVICDFSNIRHMVIYLCCALVCCFVSILIYHQQQPYDSSLFPYTQEIKYPFEKRIFEYQRLAHAVMFDSLYHGVPYVRTENDDGILTDSLNPYDPSLRGTNRYWFDYAQFNGKIYSYFGIAPVLFFYFPYYFITGKLPSYLISGLFFSLFTIVSGFLCFWAIAKRYVKSPSLVFLCLISSAVVLGLNVLMLQTCADRYYLSIASMQAFIFLVIWAGTNAVDTEKVTSKRIWYVICAFYILLLVWSRPIGVLVAASWLGPVFIFDFFDSSIKLKNRITNFLFFFIPLITFAIAAMYFNYIRFSSPFDFGLQWQLTVEDCRDKHFSFSNCFEAIFHFFFESVSFNSSFPWIRGTTDIVNYTGRYLYTSVTNGVFTLPITWGLFYAGSGVIKKDKRELKIIPITITLISIVIAVLDLSLCGITERYVCDILPGIGLVSGVILLKLIHTEECSFNMILGKSIFLLCILTFVVAINLAYWNHRNYIALYSPDSYLHMVEMFSLH